MPIVAQILCYNCQALEKHANHCYAISLGNNSFSVKPLALTPDWATKNFPDSSLQYFCSRFCAVEALTWWMNNYTTSRRFPIPSSQPAIVVPSFNLRNRSFLKNKTAS
jgi:hypothetical protein